MSIPVEPVPNPPAAPAQESLTSFLAHDRFTWFFFGAAAIVSAIMIAMMYPNYQKTKHVNAYGQHILASKYTPSLIPHAMYMRAHDPTNPEYPEVIAYAYLQNGDYAKAIAYYNEARKIDSDFKYQAFLGEAYLLSGKKEEAIPLFEEAIKRNPQDPAASYYLGVDALKAGQYAQAATLLMHTATNEKYNAKAEPYRREILSKMLGQIDLVDTTTLAQLHLTLKAAEAEAGQTKAAAGKGGAGAAANSATKATADNSSVTTQH